MPTVLLVDDEDVNLYALRIVLESRSYTCLLASSGHEALRLASEALPDAILLDINMPGMDGHEVCRRLKEDPRTAPIPIVFLTAMYREMNQVVQGLDLGAHDYITKPFNQDELLARVAVMVRVRKAENAVREASYTDDLTGLYNRRFLQQRLEEEMHRASRYGLRLSCILLDIDHFKTVNDTYGHAAGDSVLREVAVIVKRHVRRSDLAIRYGGEEIMIVLFEGDKNDSLRVAERIRADVEQHRFAWKNHAFGVTISSGVAVFPDTGITVPDELIMRADSALYQAKASGRNLVCAG